jgi:type IV pilus assembly protein PilB
MNFLALLVSKGLLHAKDRVAIEAELAKKRPLAEILAEYNIALPDALAKIASTYGLSSRVLGDPPANVEVFKFVPIDSALHYGFVPIDEVDGVLEVGTIDPDNIEALDALQFISSKIGKPYKIFLITKQDFDRVIEAYKNLSGEVGKALSEYETIDDQEAPDTHTKAASSIGDEDIGALDLTGKSEALKEDAPVTKIVSTILRYAIEGHSSDIHVEPSPEKTRIRFRMDGNLHTSLELPTKVHEAVVARIKILARLRLDEKRKPQDGRFSAMVGERRIDFRVSTFPTEYGEKVVMRILDQSDSSVTLDSVGFTPEELVQIRAMLKVPYGIILISGPTGSGKSTTLFAMLSELDRETSNVVSLEDPVEYRISGVAQSQVRPEIDYTFASGLRSILRQDPDVIMVGEIRDKETAVLAVQAALTGHLVFSTVHTNTAAGAIPRLVSMGVDPFLVAPTLVAVIGQRLVRKICKDGGAPFPVTESLKGFLDREFADLPQEARAALPPFKEFYHAVPTPLCANGTHGRTGVFEILKMNKDIEKVVLEDPIEEKIYAVARASGMLTMRESAILKALSGEIPFEEINTLGGELFLEDEMAEAKS